MKRFLMENSPKDLVVPKDKKYDADGIDAESYCPDRYFEGSSIQTESDIEDSFCDLNTDNSINTVNTREELDVGTESDDSYSPDR